jgi:hypothetical protein
VKEGQEIPTVEKSPKLEGVVASRCSVEVDHKGDKEVLFEEAAVAKGVQTHVPLAN